MTSVRPLFPELDYPSNPVLVALLQAGFVGGNAARATCTTLTWDRHIASPASEELARLNQRQGVCSCGLHTLLPVISPRLLLDISGPAIVACLTMREPSISVCVIQPAGPEVGVCRHERRRRVGRRKARAVEDR